MPNFQVVTSRPAQFLHEACRLLAGPGVTLACSGDLRRLGLDHLRIVSKTATQAEVHLEPSDVELVFKYMIAVGGVRSRIDHWQIHKVDRVLCGCFDRFSDESVWIEATAEDLQLLVDSGAIRSFYINPYTAEGLPIFRSSTS